MAAMSEGWYNTSSRHREQHGEDENDCLLSFTSKIMQTPTEIIRQQWMYMKKMKGSTFSQNEWLPHGGLDGTRSHKWDCQMLCDCITLSLTSYILSLNISYWPRTRKVFGAYTQFLHSYFTAGCFWLWQEQGKTCFFQGFCPFVHINRLRADAEKLA